MIAGFLENSKRFPDRNAIDIGDRPYSYSELLQLSAGICERIKEQESKCIGIYTDDTVFCYASIIAILLAGKTFVPLNAKFPHSKLVSIVKESGLSIILCADLHQEKLNSLFGNTEGICLVPNDTCGNGSIESIIDPAVPGEYAYVLFTSGSTGIPKGIGITHQNFDAFITAMFSSGQYDLGPEDRFLQIFELSFDVSIACAFMAWECGACLVPVPTSEIVFIRALEIIRDKQITFVSMAPSAVAYMKQLRLLEEFSFPFIRYTLLTGEALSFTIAKAWSEVAPNSIIENAYGPTEVTVWSSMYRLNTTSASEVVNGLVPIGEVLSGMEFMIVDEQLNKVADGKTGELLLYGKQVANGYWNNPEKTKSTFIQHGPLPGNWYRTGDVVVRNEKNNIVYINRIDNQVQINGFRVELGEIEFRIREFSGTTGAVVLAYEHPLTGTMTLVAFVEAAAETFTGLRRQLESALPAYMVPKKYYSVKSMPLNNSGKIDRKKLKELHKDE